MTTFRSRAETDLAGFYEALVFLHSLGSVQGEKIPRNDERWPNDEQKRATQDRRDYLKYLALLCDCEKGGQTVTAVVIQKGEGKYVYWVASNEDPEKRIAKFLRQLLEILATMDESIETRLLQMSIDFGFRKIKKYTNILRKSIDRRTLRYSTLCDIETSSSNVEVLKTGDVESVLHELQLTIDQANSHTLCESAFTLSTSVFMRTLRTLSSKRGTSLTPDQADEMDDYETIRHYLGRLSAYKYAVQHICAYTRQHPWLLQDTELRICQPSNKRGVPSMPAHYTLDDIVTRVLSITDHAAEANLLRAITARAPDVSSRMESVIRGRSFQPKLHAELILLEAVYTENVIFLAGDPFIGCSKPACYCCYHYIRLHPSGMALPATHNKIYHNWRMPDESTSLRPHSHVTNRSANWDIPTSFTARLRAKAIETLYSLPEPSERRFDSTTGVPSSAPAMRSDRSTYSFGTFGLTSEAADRSDCMDFPVQTRRENVRLAFLSLFYLLMVAVATFTSISGLSLRLPIPIWIPGLTIVVDLLQIMKNWLRFEGGRPTMFQDSLFWIASMLDVAIIIGATTMQGVLPWASESRWQAWFQNKEEEPIRRLQDRLRCCGYRSIFDRAWPFPDRTHDANACFLKYGRTDSCFAPYKSVVESSIACYIALATVDLCLQGIVYASTIFLVRFSRRARHKLTRTSGLSAPFLESRREIPELEEGPLS